MKRTIKTLISMVFCLSALSAPGDEPIDWDDVAADVSDVTETGDSPLRIVVSYRSQGGVSTQSFDDGDLWVTNAKGFYSQVSFEEFNNLFPHPGPDGEIPVTTLHAVLYEMAAPEGGWSEEHNGEYTVMLAGGEVFKSDGTSFGMTLAGKFDVAIEEEKELVQAMAGEVTVETFPTPGVPGGEVSELAVATFAVKFPFPLEVNWGEVTQTTNGGFCVEGEGYRTGDFVPQVVTTYTHRVELGIFGAGDYSVTLKRGR